MSLRDRDDTRLLLDQTNKLPAGPPPEEQLMQLISGAWISQAISVAATLGLADLMTEGPRSAEELASRVGAHAPSLYRLLRALSSVGVFSETVDRRFGLTPLAEGLRTSVKGSLRSFAMLRGEEFVLRPWAALLHTVRSGDTAFRAVYGKNPFEMFAEQPAWARVFDDAMTGLTSTWGPILAAAYDFSRASTIVDVGGGHGALLAAILARATRARGVLYELPHVVESARRALASHGLGERAQVVAGDFFAGVPEGGDVYVMKHVIHDWDDSRALAILLNVRRAIGRSGGRLLLGEVVLPAGDAPHLGKFLDIEMLVMVGGKERSEAEWRALLETAGFRLERVHHAACPLSWLEAVPA